VRRTLSGLRLDMFARGARCRGDVPAWSGRLLDDRVHGSVSPRLGIKFEGESSDCTRQAIYSFESTVSCSTRMPSSRGIVLGRDWWTRRPSALNTENISRQVWRLGPQLDLGESGAIAGLLGCFAPLRFRVRGERKHPVLGVPRHAG
jgi:hypothetical protein